MGLKILVNGEEVHETEEEAYLVESVTVGSYKVPVTFEQDEVDLVIGLKSEMDSEVIEHTSEPGEPLTKEEAEKENPPKPEDSEPPEEPLVEPEADFELEEKEDKPAPKKAAGPAKKK